LSRDQQDVFDRIAGSRGRVAGPFTVLLHAPALADRVQHVGAYLRYETELERDVAETAVLATSRAWRSAFEWEAHEPHARSAGVPDAVIDALRADADLAALPERYRVTAEYVRALASTGRVPDEIYGATQTLLGTKALVELTVLVGYYTMLAMTLGGHEID
jgi:4-carboxymuconolactone decarboxylase